MTTKVLAPPLFFRLNLSALVQRCFEWFATKAEKKPPWPDELAEVGRRILAAADVADVDRRLDGELGLFRSELPAALQGTLTVEKLDGIIHADVSTPAAEGSGVDEVLGRGATSKMDRGFALCQRVVRVGVAVMQDRDPSRRARMARLAAFDMFAEQENLPTIKQARARLIEGCRGIVAMVAVVTALQDGTRLEPWLSSVLADRFVIGATALVGLAESLPYDLAPEPVESLENRLDLGRLESEFREVQARKLAEAHRREDPATTAVFLADSEDEVRLVEVSGSASWTGEILPFRFAARPDQALPFPTVVILLNPEEWKAVRQGELHLPSGWGDPSALKQIG